jgi:uncharacterized membrane protein (GlpM family)
MFLRDAYLMKYKETLFVTFAVFICNAVSSARAVFNVKRQRTQLESLRAVFTYFIFGVVCV